MNHTCVSCPYSAKNADRSMLLPVCRFSVLLLVHLARFFWNVIRSNFITALLRHPRPFFFFFFFCKEESQKYRMEKSSFRHYRSPLKASTLGKYCSLKLLLGLSSRHVGAGWLVRLRPRLASRHAVCSNAAPQTSWSVFWEVQGLFNVKHPSSLMGVSEKLSWQEAERHGCVCVRLRRER